MYFLFNQDGAYCAHRKTKFNATEMPEKTFQLHFKDFNESLYSDITLISYDAENKQLVEETLYEVHDTPINNVNNASTGVIQNQNDMSIIKDRISNMSIDDVQTLFQEIISEMKDVSLTESLLNDENTTT